MRVLALLLVGMGLMSALAAPGAHANSPEHKSAEYVEVALDVDIGGDRSTPLLLTRIGQANSITVMGEVAHRVDVTVARVTVDDRGRSVATLDAKVFDGTGSVWRLIAEPRMVVELGGSAARTAVEPSADVPAIAVSATVRVLDGSEMARRFGGDIPTGRHCPDAESAVGDLGKVDSCCGGSCADGRRWKCCGAIQCCNVCAGAPCCNPP